MHWIRIATSLFLAFWVYITWVAQQGQNDNNILFVLLGKIPYGDKVMHFFLMGLFSGLVNLLWRGSRIQLGGFSLLKGSILVTVLVTLEECSQFWQPNRSFELLDLAADLLGIIIFGRLVLWWMERDTAKTIETTKETSHETA